MRWQILCLVWLLGGCMQSVYGPRLFPAEEPPPQASDTPLKVHLYNGGVIVLEHWEQRGSMLVGTGIRYDVHRQPEGALQEHHIPVDSIALLEMHVREGSRPIGVAGLAVWSVLYGALTVSCVINPKACFGSCPTFYVETPTGEILVAEGFSSSIARALEARDVDALFTAQTRGGVFTLTMRNEALETHAVRRLRLLAVPRPSGRRVLAGADGRFYPARTLLPLVRCQAPEGDCRRMLIALDGSERRSPADAHNLAAREVLELTFPPAQGRLALVLGIRQSLLTTFLLYETMGFLGRRFGEVLAALERMGPVAARQQFQRVTQLVGTLEITVWDGQRWVDVGTHREAGPLATDVVAYPFDHQRDDSVRIRLRAARGAWRLDWVGVALLDRPVEAQAFEPAIVHVKGMPDTTALALLRDPDRYLVTYPGALYQITFTLPAAPEGWELFLESQGYYYEWMRAAWWQDEDSLQAALMLYQPEQALRLLAPRYKQVEAELERTFWNSRFRR
ncbi:hypothetical protein [Rhodothermus profundi]|uniref:hypothetical protein n=1 Tax=Rhodothermus profundi TaxID=633813 RepID=UPI0015BEEA11|nr:hypothetical protein [Rhodothermus profundi]